ncbi:MAG: oligosaccharide repeat unit polymerase [Pelagibacteraceae bacterium]|jgi:oligosaccharide repeat unit polymerase|nr:oligosaccharide repeat unit polymerase [Pelagibacteraceae bacterium]|tara:strand:- start:2031 stop:3476 length:1446 start_codon:yes stop_codon:yes gene_type:complete
MNTALNTGTSQNDWNIDRALLFIIPLVFISVLIWMPEEWLLESSMLCISIFTYILITYKQRLVYGFSGIRIASIPSTIIATFTFFISVPAIYVLMIREHPNEVPYFYSILLFYFLFPAGLFIGQLYKKIEWSRVRNLLKVEVEFQKFDKVFYEIILILFSVSILILVTYLIRVENIPLIELIKNPGDSSRFWLLREDALKSLNMTKIERYMFFWLRSLFIPFGIIAALFLSANYRKQKYKILFVLFFVFGMVVNTLTLEKSPIASVFLSIAAYIFLKRVKVKASLIIVLIFIILAGPLLISYLLFIDREDVFNVIFWSYINRLFVAPSEVLFYYFKYFPETHDFLMGRSSQLFSWMHAEGTFPVSNYIAKLWWNMPETTGFANANYLGNFWSDFGWYGTTISTFVFGIIAHLFQWKIFHTTRYRKNLLYLITMSICVPSFTFGFFSSNFTILFFTKGLLLLVFFLFGYDYWQRRTMVKVMK